MAYKPHNLFIFKGSEVWVCGVQTNVAGPSWPCEKFLEWPCDTNCISSRVCLEPLFCAKEFFFSHSITYKLKVFSLLMN